MKESVKNFIEKNIIALEEDDIALFLYLASVQLEKQDVDILCSYLYIAGIDYRKYIDTAIKDIVKDNVAMQYRAKIKLSTLIDNIPKFNITDPLQFRKIVVDAITKVYPNKIILPDRYSGIEYVIEKI